jgi:predicted anti-sigma-YlaC factor YlaD
MPHGSINCNPKHWRDRAEDARTVAESLTNSECRRMMLQVADDYDKLANRAEERAKPVARRSARTVGTLTA